jgi:membrane protein
MVAEQRQDRRYQVLAALALFAIILALMRRGAAPLASLPRSRSHEGQAGTEAGKRTPQSAADPSGFPTQGWKAVLWSAWARFNKDRILLVAAGVTFYLLLAIFPAIAALVSLYGLFADRGALGAQMSLLDGVLPGGGVDLLREEVARIAANRQGTLSAAFLFSLAASLWSANSGMKGLFEGMNVVYEVDEKRSFIRLNLQSLGFTFAAMIFVLASLGVIVVFPIVLDFLGLAGSVSMVLRLARWPLLFFGLVLALAVLYGYGASRSRPTWRWITWGSAIASAFWLVVSILFSWYVANFGSYNATYGSLGATIGFMTWIWLSISIVLFGGELNAQLERQAGRNAQPD